MVEHGRAVGVPNAPEILELRIRACHCGSFVARDNVKPRISTRELQMEPAPFDYARLAHPLSRSSTRS